MKGARGGVGVIRPASHLNPLPYRVITTRQGQVTLDPSATAIGLDSREGVFTVKLPECPKNGEQYMLVDVGAASATYPITVDGNGKEIVGRATWTIDSPHRPLTVVYSSALSVWFITGNGYLSLPGETAIAQGTGLSASVTYYVGRGGAASSTASSMPFYIATRDCVVGGGNVHYLLDQAPGGAGATVNIAKSANGGALWTNVETLASMVAASSNDEMDAVSMKAGDLLRFDVTLPGAAPSTMITAAIPVRFAD